MRIFKTFGPPLAACPNFNGEERSKSKF